MVYIPQGIHAIDDWFDEWSRKLGNNHTGVCNLESNRVIMSKNQRSMSAYPYRDSVYYQGRKYYFCAKFDLTSDEKWRELKRIAENQ